MPSLEQKLRDAAAKKNAWIAEAIAIFHRCLDEETELVKALATREPMRKREGDSDTFVAFPKDNTPVEAVREALKAVNRGDSTIYTQEPRDLFIIDEARFGIQLIKAYLKPSLAIIYEAAAFHAIAETTFSSTSTFLSEYDTLMAEFVDDAEDIRNEQTRMASLIKTAIAEEIVKVEHERARDRILENPTIPESDKTPTVTLANQPRSTPATITELMAEIRMFHKQYADITRDRQCDKDGYQGMKEELRRFLTSSRPSKIRDEGQTLLNELLAAEKRQKLSLIARPASIAISDYLLKARHTEAGYTCQCEQAKDQLIQALAQVSIFSQEPIARYRRAAASLLAAFKVASVDKTMSWETLLAKAEELKAEARAFSGKIREATLEAALQRKHTEARERLSNLVGNNQVPAAWKTEAPTLLDAPVCEATVANMNLLFHNITGCIMDIVTFCNSIKNQLQIIIRDPATTSSDRTRLQTTLTTFKEAMRDDNWEVVKSKADAIALTLESEHQNLAKNRFRMVKDELQALVDDNNIPNELKKSAREWLAVQVTTSNAAYIQTHFLSAIAEIKEEIKRIKDFCITTKCKFELALADLEQSNALVYQFQEEAKTLLREYNATNADNLVELHSKAKRMTREIFAIETNAKMHPLRDKIALMLNYAENLPGSSNKRSIIIKLADDLNNKLREYLVKLRTETYLAKTLPQEFEKDFKQLLDDEKTKEALQRHRAIWKPIIANILIALIPVVGILAIIVKVSVHAIDCSQKGKKFTFNHAFFAAKTNSELCMEDIEAELTSPRK